MGFKDRVLPGALVVGSLLGLIFPPVAIVESAASSDNLAQLDADPGAAVAESLPNLNFLVARPWFAGIWVDTSAGGQVVVATSRTPDVTVTDLLALLAPGASVRFETVKNSLADLTEARAKLQPSLDASDAFDKGFRSLWIDIPNNVVHLGLALAQKNTSMAQTMMALPLVDVDYERDDTLVSCTLRSNCANPLKGGITVYSNTNPIQGVTCTSGFMGRPVSGTPTASYVITAGHCIYNASSHNTETSLWLHNSNSIGIGAVDNYFNGSNADFGIISVYSWTVLGTSPANQLFATSGSDIRSITGIVIDSVQAAGVTMYVAGQSTGSHYWPIAATDVSHTPESGITLHHQWLLAGHVAGGDSGGAVYKDTRAGGIVSFDFFDDRGYEYIGYGTMSHIIAAGWRPCYYSTHPC
jgi:hypothetical protein